MNEDFIPLFSVLSGRFAPLPEYREKELGGLGHLAPICVHLCLSVVRLLRVSVPPW
jgi:hypothetical protein